MPPPKTAAKPTAKPVGKPAAKTPEKDGQKKKSKRRQPKKANKPYFTKGGRAKINNTSSSFLWLAMRKNNCFSFKQPGINKVFTKDPLNPAGIQTFRNSGRIHRHAYSVEEHPSGKGVNLLVNSRKIRKPEKRVRRVQLTKGFRRTSVVIRKTINKDGLRRGQKYTILRRASALMKSQEMKRAKPIAGKTSKKKA